MTGSSRSTSDYKIKLTGVTRITTTTTSDVPFTDTLVTPENTNDNSEPAETDDKIPTPVPIGHDTATTTDEEEATEELLALGNLPNYDDADQDEDNATLMPIGKASTAIDVNPVPLKLSTEDVNTTIQNIPEENKLKLTGTVSSDTAIKPTDETVSATPDDEIITDPLTPMNPPSSPKPDPATTTQKGKLKVKKYGLKKTKQLKRTYKCQNCGKKEGSVHDLNEHHCKDDSLFFSFFYRLP